mgnify:CR=1 FL=1
MSTPRDATRVVDMVKAARTILRYVAGVTETEFARQVTIIAEAANQLSAKFRETHPELPWIEMIGMRHRLVHGYGEVSLRTVWDTCAG